MKDQKKAAGWFVAGAAALFLALVLTTGNQTDARADQTLQQHEGLFRQLFPYAGEGAESFERMAIESKDGLEMAYTILRGGEPLGFAAKQTVQGYGGPIEIIVGLRTDGTLVGIHVGGPNFNETAGLGAKAKDPDFTDQFVGKSLPLTLGKEIDAISGATVTSKAVVDGVNAAGEKLAGYFTPNTSSNKARMVNASAIGYGGPVLARVGFDADGTIASLDIGGVRFAETDGVGSHVRDSDFASQFIGKKPPVSLGKEIDALAGATVSSQAVVDAVNDAAAFLAKH